MVILNYRSTYLQRILSTNKKKNGETLVHIKLPNILPENFQIILRYIYGGSLSLDECDTLRIFKVLVAASELNLQELVDYLQLYIIKNDKNWMDQNFSLIYQTSFENNSFLELQKYCTDLTSKRPDKILKSISLSSIPEKLLVSILQNNSHQMSEIQVWKYVVKWGIAQNPELPSDPATFSKEDFNVLKNTLQRLIPFIEFSNLTAREFSDEILPYKRVLPKELYKDLLKTFLNSHPDTIPNDNLKIQNFDSKIITFQHVELISKWIDKLDITDKSTPLYEFKLTLRGSRDGLTPDKFHDICDDRSCTLTIVKVKGNDQILGGYNPIEWKSERGYVATKDSFIFSFKNGDDINDHILSRVVNENYAIFNDQTYGPSFGCTDLILRGDSGYCIKDSYEKQIRGASSESALHYGVSCDCCNYTIRGERWKCTSCENYDLCQVCKTKSNIHNHPDDHGFKLIPHSETSGRAPQFFRHYGVMCDSCEKTIRGMRWKCLFCKNYDLCQDCKSKSPNVHDNNHAFQPIAYSGLSLFEMTVGRNATCDYCKLTCTGNRCYKCANGEFPVEEYELFQVIKR
ncbi:carbohydrate-binding module family 13 protein [Rhizophagus clarus]|nr:carbohydrate-binding module family 13 protein [Rhizophagus clarus]